MVDDFTIHDAIRTIKTSFANYYKHFGKFELYRYVPQNESVWYKSTVRIEMRAG